MRPSRRWPAGVSAAAESADRREALCDGVPVDDVPPRVDVVGATVLVLQVVGVLPHVDAQQRGLAGREGRVLVGRSEYRETRSVVDQPGPARAELVDARRLQRGLEVGERAECGLDSARQGAARGAAAAGAHALPEERVVVVAAGVVT